jgi:hypothetical protein
VSSYRTFQPGETLADDEIQDLGLRGTYTPTLEASTTNPTMGTGAVTTGDWHLNNGIVTLRFTIQFGTAGAAAGTGTYRITLPTNLDFDADWQDNIAIGNVFLNDSSGAAFRCFPCRTSSSNPSTIVMMDPTAGTLVAATSPWTWANNDYLRGSVRYKTDFT